MTSMIRAGANLPRRDQKDQFFCMVFREKKELLSLYNALHGTNYTNPEDISINTLENAIFMNMKNDISFVLDSRLSLYEHQSTFNPNMPLRNLFYVSKLYSQIVRDANLYGTKRVLIPTPQFITFYNGTSEQPERLEQRLSESYAVNDQKPALELTNIMLNINKGKNDKLLQDCETLGDYMTYVEKVRTYAKTMPIDEAVDRAIDECIRDGVLSEFLSKNRAEAKYVCIFEYDEEKARRAYIESGREEGLEQGLEQGREEGRALGREFEIFTSVQEKDYSLERGAQKLHISVEEFEKRYQEWLANH